MLIGHPKNEKGIPLDGIDSIPVGTIVMFAGSSSIPNGFLLCDGSELSRETYPELFSVIETTWGSGDGVNTFNLPDIVNKTVWGGNSESVGGYKEAGLPGITGSFYWVAVDASQATASGAITQGSSIYWGGGHYR